MSLQQELDRLEDIRAEHYTEPEPCGYGFICEQCPLQGDDISCFVAEAMEEFYSL